MRSLEGYKLSSAEAQKRTWELAGVRLSNKVFLRKILYTVLAGWNALQMRKYISKTNFFFAYSLQFFLLMFSFIELGLIPLDPCFI